MFREETGWLFMLWQLCRPPEAEPPGFGMSWQDAKRLNPTIAHFLLSSESEAKRISRRFRMRFLEASGALPKDKQSVKQSAKAYMAALRQHYNPTGEP